MKLEITKEQFEEIKRDGFLHLMTEDYGFGIYTEYDTELQCMYGELWRTKNNKREAQWFDRDIMQKALPQRCHDPSYFHNDPLCPRCYTYMIYKFDYCPKCGQKLDWSEE